MAGKDEDMVIIEEKDPIEEVDTGDIDSTQDEEKEKKEVKQLTKKPRSGADGNKKRGNDNQKRMNELWAAAKEKDYEAKREKAKNAEYEKITAAALEENINTKRELLTERLIRAQESGDTKKSAEITAELTKIEAQSAQIDRYKVENQVRGNQQQQPQYTQQEEQVSEDDMYDRMSPAGKKWLDDNSKWFNSSGSDYDADKSGDVTYYAQTLESEYRNSGRTAEIGTRAYFKKIDDYIRQNWSDDVQDDEAEDEVTPQVQKRGNAAPVGNRSATTPPASQRKEYKITQQEKEFALALNTKGRDGKPLSDDEKIKRFVGLREGTPSSGPISMSTIKKGN